MRRGTLYAKTEASREHVRSVVVVLCVGGSIYVRVVLLVGIRGPGRTLLRRLERADEEREVERGQLHI